MSEVTMVSADAATVAQQRSDAPEAALDLNAAASDASLCVVAGKRILCIAELRGALSQVNALAEKYRADVVVHTGNFGFFDAASADNLPFQSILNLVRLSPFVRGIDLPEGEAEVRQLARQGGLSELQDALDGRIVLNKPLYTTYGAHEDVAVLEKFRSHAYHVANLYIVDERSSFVLSSSDPNAATVRLHGLGGAFLRNRLLDRGHASGSIAGSNGLTWITLWQLAELAHTVEQTYQQGEINLLLCHEFPKEFPMLEYFALLTRMDYCVSSGIHSLYTTSTGASHLWLQRDLANLLYSARTQFQLFWDECGQTVRDIPVNEEDPGTAGLMRQLILSASELFLTEYAVYPLRDVYSHQWHFNLCDYEVGVTVLSVNDWDVSAEHISKGFDFTTRHLPLNNKTNKHNESISSFIAAESTKNQFMDGKEKEVRSERRERKREAFKEAREAAREAKAAKEAAREAARDAAKEAEPVNEAVSEAVKEAVNAGESDNESQDLNGTPESRETQEPRETDATTELAKSTDSTKEPKREFKPRVPPNTPALCFKDGTRQSEDILSCLADEDRQKVVGVIYRATAAAVAAAAASGGGQAPRSVFVRFETAEDTQQAYDRLNKDAAGTVSIQVPPKSPMKKPMRRKLFKKRPEH